MAKDEQFKKRFLAAVEENLHIKPENKNFLISHFDELPEFVLKDAYEKLQKGNDLTEKYIEIAIKHDPSIVEDMKSTLKKVKKDVTKLKESEEKSDLEEKLEEELENI